MRMVDYLRAEMPSGGRPQVDTRKEIASGSEQEAEIRACTVVAVERLRDALVAKYGALAAADGRVPPSEAAMRSTGTLHPGNVCKADVSCTRLCSCNILQRTLSRLGLMVP